MSEAKVGHRWSELEPFALGVSGKIGSGKTTLISKLREEYDFSVASYGAFFRSLAIRRNLPENREAYQRLTSEFLCELGHNGLAEKVIMSSGWAGSGSLLIDGVRHIESMYAIGNLIHPLPLFSIFLEVPEETRVRRIGERDGLLPDAVKLHDGHESEQLVTNEIRSAADLIIAESSTDAAIDKIFEFITNVK